MGRPRLTEEERKERIKNKNTKYYAENKAKWEEYNKKHKADPLTQAKRSLKRLSDEEKAIIFKEIVTQ